MIHVDSERGSPRTSRVAAEPQREHSPCWSACGAASASLGAIFVKVYAPGDLFAYDRSMDNETFLQRLLEIMERKDHWAWPRFTSGEV
ncbi:MAG: hypothetical protein AAGE52_20580, partial [Myxococcota bacterium]